MSISLDKAAPSELFHRVEICTDIDTERRRQDLQWGGPDHDDQHTPTDWMRYRDKFEALAFLKAYSDPEQCRVALIKLAALTVAQIESLDRRIARERTAAVQTDQAVAR